MSTTPKFCGKCGAPVSDVTARFCGGCGKPISQAEKQSPPSPGCDALFSRNSISSGYQWAMIWLIGWLPIGILFSFFYDNKRGLNPEFYSNYPRTFSTTLFGMTLSYSIGGLVAGFLAGISLYRIFNRKKLSIGPTGIIPAVVFALLWGTTFWIMTLPTNLMSDGTLLIATPVLGIFFGMLMSRVAILCLEKKYTFSATPREKKMTLICWSIFSLLGVIIATGL